LNPVDDKVTSVSFKQGQPDAVLSILLKRCRNSAEF